MQIVNLTYINKEELFMNSLQAFQTFMKVFRVIAIIAFVCLVIAFAGLIFIYFSAGSVEFIETLNAVLIESGIEPFGDDIQAIVLSAAISILGAAVVTFMTMRYLKHEIKKGTPFDFDGAKELFVLSMVSIFLPMVISFVNGLIVAGAGTTMLGETSMMTDSITGSGLILLAGSFAFKYGAELRQKVNGTEQKEEEIN